MDFSKQLLFFFSALGAFNGLFLSFYFAFFIKKKSLATYFLSALLFVVSVRVTKSVFLTFYPDISNAFIELGLTACLLIGPFLYLYVRQVVQPRSSYKWSWLVHILPVMVLMSVVAIYYPYFEYYYLWRRNATGTLGWILFSQWLAYLLIAIYTIRNAIKKVFSRDEKATSNDFWLVNIVLGIGLVWLAYNTTQYTSYIVGALSFSFLFYLTIIIWFYKRSKNVKLLFDQPTKYANKKIDSVEADKFLYNLNSTILSKELYKNPNLKLIDLAEELSTAPHYLSQFLNDNLGKSFSTFINEYRIDAAKKMLLTNLNYTNEAIGYECGFNSKSTFFTTFKKMSGTTPANFKKENT